MAASACVLTAADSTSPSRLISNLNGRKLHKPYLLSSPELETELVTPRSHSKPKHSETMRDLPAAETLTMSPFLEHNQMIMNNSFHTQSMEKIRQEELNSIAPKHSSSSSSSSNHLYLKHSPYRSPPRHYKEHARVGSQSARIEPEHSRIESLPPHATYPYVLHATSRKRFESVPNYDTIYRTSLPPNFDEHHGRNGYDDFDIPSSTFSGKCPEGCPCSARGKHDIKSRPHSKPRFKYTPIRNDIPLNYYERQFRGNQGKVEGSNADPLSPRWSQASFPRYEEPHPYYHMPEQPDSPISRSFLERSMRYEHERSKRESDYSIRIEANEKRSSAFSVIRPSAINRVYSNESGYASDPTNTSMTHKGSEGPEYSTKYRHPSYSEPEVSKVTHRPYHDQSRHDIREQGQHTTIYDEASKAALKAFDAHIEKMMAESRDSRKSRDNPRDHTVVQHKHEMNQEKSMHIKHERRFSSTSSPPHALSSPPHALVQVSTVDSTQTPNKTQAVGGLLGLTMVANEHLGQAIAKEKRRTKNNNCLHLWQFLRSMLDQEKDKPNKCIEWTNRDRGEFRLIKTAVIADLWGQSKNRTCMTYEKMARAMRYYYKMKILEKVPHKRLHFRFGEKMLAKVLDSSTLKPLRHTSVSTEYADKGNSQNSVITPEADFLSQRNTQTHPYYENKMIKRPASEGSIPTYVCPAEALKAPQTFQNHNGAIPISTIQTTPVIRSTNSEINIQQASENKSANESNNSPSDTNLTPSDSDNGVASYSGDDNGVASYSGDDTPVSSPMSEYDGELIVDTEAE